MIVRTSGAKRRDAKQVGVAGRHFVCYCLARRHIRPVLRRAETRGVEILATVDGSTVVTLQVKASWAANQPRRWAVGKHRLNHSETFFYVFCNIWEDFTREPEVFVVPSKLVYESSTWQNKVPIFAISKETELLFKDKWGLIEATLFAGRHTSAHP